MWNMNDDMLAPRSVAPFKCNRNTPFEGSYGSGAYQSRPIHEQVGSKAEHPSQTIFKDTPSFAEHLVDEVAVGDLNSDAKGSGARKNAGKAQLDLVPVCFWRMAWSDDVSTDLDDALCALQDWQEGDNVALLAYFGRISARSLLEATKVLEFGAAKYKAWNWAKGMPWSVPTGCVLRHAQQIINGQHFDEESKRPHMAHIVCNMMMLAYYLDAYPEGDDRPPS